MLLAGGGSRRFGGEPKGLVELGGQRIADRVLRALEEATEGQLVIANDPRAREWFPHVELLADIRPGLGPLAGIETALQAACGGSIVIVAWDMPFVTGALLKALRALGRDGVEAVVPSHGPRGETEPLCAWYSGAALPACRRLIDVGERRARALPAALPAARPFGGAELTPFGDAARLFTSVDTPDDVARARRMVEGAPSR